MLLKPLNITGVKQHHETESLKPLETSKQKKNQLFAAKSIPTKVRHLIMFDLRLATAFLYCSKLGAFQVEMEA